MKKIIISIISLLAIGIVGWFILPEKPDIPFGEKPIPIEHQLITDKENILGSWEQDFIECDDDHNCINHGKYKYYKYKGEEMPAFEPNEIQRTVNAREFRVKKNEDGSEERVAEFVAGASERSPAYHQDKDKKWWNVKENKTTIEAFELQTRTSFPERLLGLLVGKGVEADTLATYSSSGDGYVGAVSEASWNAARDHAGEDSSSTLVEDIVVQSRHVTCSGNCTMYRGLFPVLTGEVILATYTITSASFDLRFHYDTNIGSIGLIASTTQDQTYDLANGDYAKCGYTAATDGGTLADSLAAQTVAANGIATDAWLSASSNEFVLNATGLKYVMRNGEDASCGDSDAGGAATGWTCLGLRAVSDIDRVGFADEERWDVFYEESTSKPTFRVGYTVPSVAPKKRINLD